MDFQEESKQTAEEIIQSSQTAPQYLLVSESFYDEQEYSEFPAIQLEFYSRFSTWIEKLSHVLGPATIACPHWPDFPEHSSAFYIASWNRQNTIYTLELQHEDRECPLIIVFSQQA